MVLSTEFCISVRRKPRYKTPSLFSMLQLKNPLPYSLEYTKDQRNRLGVSRKQYSCYFQRGQLPHLPCKGVHIRPQLPLQEVNENIDIRGPHFRSGTSILLTRSILPEILLRTKNDKHKQRMFRSSEHKCAYLYPDLGKNNGHKRQVSS